METGIVDEIRILSTMVYSAEWGEAWERGLSWKPDVIAAQGTSSDCGPGFYGSKATWAPARRSLETIIRSAKRIGVPFIVSAGTPAGTNHQLETSLAWVEEMTRNENLKLRVAIIPGELDKAYLKRKIKGGAKIQRLVDTHRLPRYLTEEDVDKSECIVTQMGPEPIMKALELDVDGIITGRALDIALHMALPLKKGFDKGLVAHMAKTIECSSIVTDPQVVVGSVFAILKKDHFLVWPTNPLERCTTVSVAAHSFYERPDPFYEDNPGGSIDISKAKYEQYDERTVKVSGARWIPARYALKIEGVQKVGYRSISIMGVRDPWMIESIDWCLEDTRKHIEEHFRPLRPNMDYTLTFRVYGKDGVLGDAEPIKKTSSHELGIIVDVVAPDEEVSYAICQSAGLQGLHHMDYPGRLSTGGNIAFPYSPSEHKLGPTYVFNIWHLLPLDDPCEPFNIEVKEFPLGK